MRPVQQPPHHPSTNIIGLALLTLLIVPGCIEHRVAVSPPLPADPPPAGETPATTVLIAGSRFQNEPDHPETFSSALPLDIPISVYRRESDGTITRGELRVTTELPWWQRFPVDAFVDLAPVDATVDAVGMATLSPVPLYDRAAFISQAERDGYARSAAPVKSTP